MEVGPWRSDGNGGWRAVDGGWEEYTTMVFSAYLCYMANVIVLTAFQSTSQPGLVSRMRRLMATYMSSLKCVHVLNDLFSVMTCAQASKQMVYFLRNFYEVFPEYRTMDVRISCGLNTYLTDSVML